MSASSEVLAQAICDRLGPHLPSNILLHVDQDGVSVLAHGEPVGKSGAFAVLNDTGGPVSTEHVATASRMLLGAVQDYIADSLKVQWPLDAAGQSGEPFADITSDGAIVLEYRSGDVAVLRLPPVLPGELIT